MSAERPNILFLFPEDMRVDCIAAYGNPHIRTPQLDRLVARSFNFRQNYCAGSNSGAVCVPSRAMLMTGKPWLQIDNEMKGERIFPELLREAGYTTFITGKWHNGEESVLRGFERGEAVFIGGMSDHRRVPIQTINNGELVEPRYGNKFSSELFAETAISFINNYCQESPFFAYCAFTAPHDPRQPPNEYVAEYYERQPPLPPNFLERHPFNNGSPCETRDEELGGWPRTEVMVRDQLAEYYGMVTHLDSQIGRILDALECSPHWNNTIIILGVDHGLALGSHGLLGKQNIYEHSMRVPLLIAGPGIPQGESNALTYLMDIFPTICALTGTAAPRDLSGKDLSAIWKGDQKIVREAIFLPYRDMQRGVRNERWKLHCYPHINHRLLFNLVDDPHEIVNLAATPDHANTVADMFLLMEQCQREFGDYLPLSVDDPGPHEWKPPRERIPDRWQPRWIRNKYFDGAGPNEQSRREQAAEAAIFTC